MVLETERLLPDTALHFAGAARREHFPVGPQVGHGQLRKRHAPDAPRVARLSTGRPTDGAGLRVERGTGHDGQVAQLPGARPAPLELKGIVEGARTSTRSQPRFRRAPPFRRRRRAAT